MKYSKKNKWGAWLKTSLGRVYVNKKGLVTAIPKGTGINDFLKLDSNFYINKSSIYSQDESISEADYIQSAVQLITSKIKNNSLYLKQGKDSCKTIVSIALIGQDGMVSALVWEKMCSVILPDFDNNTFYDVVNEYRSRRTKELNLPLKGGRVYVSPD